MAFIHQEVYVDNDAAKGLRPQLEAFDLRSEPWLFTFDKEGRVAARLEGSSASMSCAGPSRRHCEDRLFGALTALWMPG